MESTKKPKESKLHRLKKMSKHFANTSTVFYGLDRVTRAPMLTTKIVWTVLTLVSLSLGVYIVTNSVLEFLKFEVSTHTKRIQVESNIFPAVAFCSDHIDFRADQLFTRAVFVNGTSFTNLSGEIFAEKSLAYGNLDTFHCIRFNNHRTETSHENLISSEDINNHYFQFEISNKTQFSFLHLFLSDNYVNTVQWSQYMTGFSYSKGHYWIDVSKSIEHRLENPFNDCQLTGDPAYRQVNCMAQCRNNELVRKYNCTIQNYYLIPGYEYCKSDSAISEFDSVCEGQCPKECISVRYTSGATKYDYEVMKIDLFYMDLSFIEIGQTRQMNGFSLVSELGGALGLFVGITFLSVFQFLEYLIEIFLILSE